MTAQPSDLGTILRALRKDLTLCQARVTELLNTVAALNLDDLPPAKCPTCGVEFRGEFTLAEHRYNSHGGPVPEHYRVAERAAGLDTGNSVAAEEGVSS